MNVYTVYIDRYTERRWKREREKRDRENEPFKLPNAGFIAQRSKIIYTRTHLI